MALIRDGYDNPGSDGNQYDGMDAGDVLDKAEQDSASYDRASYDGNQQGSGSFDTAFGWDNPRDIAKGMANAGFSDRDISEALANWGSDYATRAGIVGPIDAIAQGELSGLLSRGLSVALFQASPLGGLLSSAADRYQRGSLTGDYGDLVSMLGGIAGTRIGAEFGADIGGNIQSALAGLTLGGIGGSYLGRQIGSGAMVGASQPSGLLGSSQGKTASSDYSQVRQQPLQPQTTMPPYYGFQWY